MSLTAVCQSQGNSNVSFEAREEDELLFAALEGGLEPSEADDSTELAPSGAAFQSEADAEMVAMLALAAKSIKLERTPPQCPEHSRLDDFFWVLSMTLNRTQPQFLSS